MFFQVPLSGKKTEKKFICTFFSKLHAEISVEASRFFKILGFFFIRRHGLSFFKKSYLFVYFFLRQHNKIENCLFSRNQFDMARLFFSRKNRHILSCCSKKTGPCFPTRTRRRSDVFSPLSLHPVSDCSFHDSY